MSAVQRTRQLCHQVLFWASMIPLILLFGLFINPMWDSETQRIGKQKCTPVGSILHGVSDLLGFLGLLALVVVVFYLIVAYAVGAGVKPWLLTIPYGTGLLAKAMFVLSDWLAGRKGFRYDAERDEASWIEGGVRRMYSYRPPP